MLSTMQAPFLFSLEILEQLRCRYPKKYLDDCFEYLVMLPPGAEIAGKVTGWKEDMMARGLKAQSLHSEPHFTIACLALPKAYENHLLRAFASACSSIGPQQLSVDGFGKFPNGRGRNVIFVKTPDVEFFAAAQLQVKRALRHEGLKRCAQYSGNPHLTIVKDLSDVNFLEEWRRFEGLTYGATFQADTLTLLRRPLGRYTKCKEIISLPLTGPIGGHIFLPTVEQQPLF